MLARSISLLLLASCAQSTESPPPPPKPKPPAPVAIPPKVGEAMELLALACPGALGVAPAAVEAALRQHGHGITSCFTASATATVELAAEGVRSIEAATPALETCLGHALRRVRIPDGLVGAKCSIDYELTR